MSAVLKAQLQCSTSLVVSLGLLGVRVTVTVRLCGVGVAHRGAGGGQSTGMSAWSVCVRVCDMYIPV